MLGILFIMAILFLCLIFSFIINMKNIMNPQNFFLGGFLAAVSYSIFYIKKMEMNLSIDTIMVLTVGTALFSVVSFIVSLIYNNTSIASTDLDICSKKDVSIRIESWKLMLVIGIELFSVIVFMVYMIKISGEKSFSAAINYHRNILLFTEDTLNVPTYVTLTRLFTLTVADVFIFLIIHQLINHYRANLVLDIIGLLLSVVSTLEGGGRTGLIGMIFNAVVIAFFIYKDKYNWKKKIGFKTIIILTVLFFVLVVLFYIYAVFMRNSKRSIGEYIFIYLSAPIKNLDTFIRNGNFGTSIQNNQTLANARIFLANKLNIAGASGKIDLPFTFLNDFSLGNVYTMYYMFLYDGGFKAVWIYTALMAAISQVFYQELLRSRLNKMKINILLIIYCKFGYALLFCFFSNRFFELITDIAFYRGVIILLLLNWFFNSYKECRYADTFSDKKAYGQRRYTFLKKYRAL